MELPIRDTSGERMAAYLERYAEYSAGVQSGIPSVIKQYTRLLRGAYDALSDDQREIVAKLHALPDAL